MSVYLHIHFLGFFHCLFYLYLLCVLLLFGVIVSSFNYIAWFDLLVLLTVILWLFRHLRFKWWPIPWINVWVNAFQLCWNGIQIKYAISNCCFFFTNSVWSSLKYNLHDSIDFSWMSSKQPSDVNMASSKLVMQLAILKFLFSFWSESLKYVTWQMMSWNVIIDISPTATWLIVCLLQR